jgi:uncharacterized protein
VATVVSGDFEWDDVKALENLKKHGVSFEEASVALATDDAEIAFADSLVRGRIQSLVMSVRARVLFVVTTERVKRTRIISARKADRDEERTYAAG